MLELERRVLRVGWGDDAGEAVDGMREGDVVNLRGPPLLAFRNYLDKGGMGKSTHRVDRVQSNHPVPLGALGRIEA